ncbi:hypothetical protein SMY85_001088 [Cronobacter sakazakii]|uniref:hypothetical protein n=1 Tax=Escherichia coli TaxID=562 RepID=UPI000BE6DC2D|nr:hypothetical protein [Escherichia coli]EJE8234124.1 hypothetical protein [Escherichia coli]EJE8380836.1 hypothetical protein [Escherichia coli]ELY4223393.1 hypothetical protein [Cronobacter sakazakii]
MNMHDRLRIVFAEARQFWWAFAYVMHLHENRYKKRAGVAGIRARASKFKLGFKILVSFLLERKYYPTFNMWNGDRHGISN